MAEIINNEIVQIGAIRSNDNVNINISGSKRMKLSMAVEFIQKMQRMVDKKIILTSATFGSWNYKSVFIKGTKVEDIMFGIDGDPKDTNSKMLILADSKRYSNIRGRYSINSNREQIAKQVIQVLDEIDEECFIIASNIEQADMLQKELKRHGYNNEVNYYGSDKTIGVKSSARVAIAINPAYAPSVSSTLICRNNYIVLYS